MNIMVAYDNSTNAKQALEKTPADVRWVKTKNHLSWRC